MHEQENYTVSRPGVGDVTNGDVDYYPMDWEIVGKEDARPDGAGGETAAPAAQAASVQTAAATSPSRPTMPAAMRS